MFGKPAPAPKQYAIWQALPGSQSLFLSSPVREVCFAGTRGPGKGLPLSETVYTTNGPRTIGELKVGDYVSCPDGSISAITGVFPQGKRRVFKITFADGSVARCDDQHIWNVHIADNSRVPAGTFKNVQMLEVLEHFNTGWKRITIPTLAKLEMPMAANAVPMDAYLLGLMLGDGTFSQRMGYCTVDEELAKYVLANGVYEVSPDPRSGLRCFIPTQPIRNQVVGLGLKETRSHTKFVPTIYLNNSPEVRLAVLQGLMDTDGTIDKKGYVTFCSVSEQLAKDVQYLARSLGAKATLTSSLSGNYGLETGIAHQRAYSVYIQAAGKFSPFRLQRKVDRLKPYMHKHLTNKMCSIEEQEPEETVCIKIAHPDGLFVTNDFVVTHNTDAMLMSFAQYCGRGYGDYMRGIIFRRNYKHLDDIIAKSKRWFNKSAMQPRFLAGSSSLKWVWPTGEELLLRAFEDENDYWSYHGHEYPFIGWEELTSWPNINCYESMKSCNRSSFQPTARLPHLPRLIRSSTNPYGVGHCVPYGEVLTTNGWVDIKNVKVGDKVYSCTPDGNLVEKDVAAVIAANYTGPMVSRVGRGLHMEFTPNHRLPHLNTAETIHTVKPFNKLPGDARIRRAASSWNGLEVATIEGFEAGDFMELLGWFIAEGCMVNREDKSEENSFNIAQSKLPTWQRILDLLNRMGVKFRIDSNGTGFTVTNKVLADIFRKQGKCRTKHIPKEYSNYSTALLERLLEALMLGDGCRGMYYTLSEQLSNDVQELAIKLGYCVYASQKMQKPYKDGSRKTPSSMSYAVSISKRGPTQLRTGNHKYDVPTECNFVNVEHKDYVGQVYCITVPGTETFFIRQNGCVWLSGNSWVKSYFIDPAPYGKIITDKDGNQRCALFGSVKENPYLGQEYIQTLESITDANKRKAWLEGSWDITSGGMFDDLWAAEKHVLQPFEIPHSWRITRSFDWGSSKPFSCGWWAISDGTEATLKDGRKISFPRKTLFRIGEWYGCEEGKPNTGLRLPAKVVAQGIQIRETQMRIQNRVHPGPADSAIYAVTDEASIGQNMEAEGVFWTPADKRPGSRKNGWELMRDRLDAVAKAEDKPGMYVFDTCRDFIRTVPNIARDQRDPDDVDTDAEDHIADDCRYMVLSADHVVHRLKITGA